MSAAAVIVAGGRGERLGSPKQFLPLGGLPMLLWSVRSFEAHPGVSEIVVVLPAEAAAEPPPWLKGESVRCCAGGDTRRASAGLGVLSVDSNADWILIHDAARPFLTSGVIDRVLAAASDVGAALPVLPVSDTIKRVEGGRVVDTPDRSRLGRAQTPQAFEAGLIRHLHAMAAEKGISASDDVALCESEGHPVAAVEGDPWNLKITTPADLALAEWLVTSGRVSVPRSGSETGDPF
jgi:2-C-methyl-D-erythritol 4-phosphate cytidylyltransferase